MLTKSASRPAQELNDLIGQIADSETFRTAPVMRTLLLYLWTHKGETLSEYAIAVDALGRSPGFDPKTDSTVRVQVARLRVKLKDFYETAGEGFPLRISIPLGGQEIHWTYARPRGSVASTLGITAKRYLIGAAMAVLAMAVFCCALLVQNHKLNASIASASPPFPRFWQSFLAGHKPTLIVIPSPTYFFGRIAGSTCEI